MQQNKCYMMSSRTQTAFALEYLCLPLSTANKLAYLSWLMYDDLHWLVQRVKCKLAMTVTVYRCLRHRAPRYLVDYCVPVFKVPGCQQLRSARSHELSVPRVCDRTFGTRAFSVAGPTVWNLLPDHTRNPAVDSKQFRQDLKTYLFARHLRR